MSYILKIIRILYLCSCHISVHVCYIDLYLTKNKFFKQNRLMEIDTSILATPI